MKSIIIPENVETIQHHIPVMCYGRPCTTMTISESIAQTSHYRNKPMRLNLNQKVLDKTVWKFKIQLIKEVNKTLEDTNFQP